jgi:hypothetical protein
VWLLFWKFCVPFELSSCSALSQYCGDGFVNMWLTSPPSSGNAEAITSGNHVPEENSVINDYGDSNGWNDWID